MSHPDKYRLIESRSQGGEGTVWKGTLDFDGMEVPVAVKVMLASNAAEVDQWRERWQRQAELLRSLDHPGLVTVREVFDGPPPHEVGAADLSATTLYLVMNWVEGPTLAEWVQRTPNRDPVESLRVIGALAGAVDYLHTFGGGKTPILHRDIKPSNVILSSSGAKLVDFGFARPAESGIPMSSVFTPRYTAPEAAIGIGYTPASDRFALGATAYFALTGHNPTLDDPALMRKRLDDVPGFGGRSDIQEAVLSMLSVDPASRPSSTIGWAQSLAMASIVGPLTMVGSAPIPLRVPGQPTGPGGRNTRGRALVGGAVVLSIALGALLAQALFSNEPEALEAAATTLATTSTAQVPSTSSTTEQVSTTSTDDPVTSFAVPTPRSQVPPGNGAGNPANGSGCTPPGETLPDGVWFGYLLDVVQTGGAGLVFDMGCFYDGTAAVEEALFDDIQLYGELWYYVRNRNPLEFTPQVASSAAAYWVDGAGDYREVPFSRWPVVASILTCPGADCGVWLEVQGGIVVALWEQEPQYAD